MDDSPADDGSVGQHEVIGGFGFDTPGPGGCESDPSFPSGFPVLKTNTSAIAGAAATRPTESAAADAAAMYAFIKTSPRLDG